MVVGAIGLNTLNVPKVVGEVISKGIDFAIVQQLNMEEVIVLVYQKRNHYVIQILVQVNKLNTFCSFPFNL